MKSYTKIRDTRGFSLVEAIIAMFVVSVGVLAVGLLQISATKGNTTALNRGDGVAVAQTVMDLLRTLPLDDALLTDDLTNGVGQLDDGVGTPPNPAGADHSGTEIFATNPLVSENGGSFTVFWNIAEDVPLTNARTVRVHVYWTDSQAGQHRTVMTSVVGGLYL